MFKVCKLMKEIMPLSPVVHNHRPAAVVLGEHLIMVCAKPLNCNIELNKNSMLVIALIRLC